MSKLKERREALGLTQRQVAERANLAESAYQRYERGVTEPSISMALRLAKALNATAEELYSLSIMSETLKDLRLHNKKTCAEVAQALNVTKNAVSNYESGIRNISLEQVVTLARLYDCSEREIIDAALNSRFSR